VALNISKSRRKHQFFDLYYKENRLKFHFLDDREFFFSNWHFQADSDKSLNNDLIQSELRHHLLPYPALS